jgi:regulator of sigma E protease
MQGSFLGYLGAFALALGILIVVHELGHYWVARLVGVKVLRFSVGFGKSLISRRFGSDRTEWSIAAFPLGGYVKMLDEREGEVPAGERNRAFNRQSLGRRSLIVVAGPLANLLLAVLLYWVLFVVGVVEMKPILSAPPANTAAARAGIVEGELVRSVSGAPVVTLQDLRWQLMDQLLNRQTPVLELTNLKGEIAYRTLDASDLDPSQLDADFLRQLGLLPFRPKLKPIIGLVASGSIAEAAGMAIGDVITAIDGRPLSTWSDVASTIRNSPGKPMTVTALRDGALLNLYMVPRTERENGRIVGRIGVGVRDDPEWHRNLAVEVRSSIGDGLRQAVAKTWETSVFSLRMIGRMIVGELSWKNVSGPVTIADYAGQSAHLGLDHYLRFIALISISLGVLNLLPIPILDGGHLLYYLIEFVRGGPMSERAMEIGQQIGLGLLLTLMAIAFYNDINRLISG